MNKTGLMGAGCWGLETGERQTAHAKSRFHGLVRTGESLRNSLFPPASRRLRKTLRDWNSERSEEPGPERFQENTQSGILRCLENSSPPQWEEGQGWWVAASAFRATTPDLSFSG
jgi:hypothetical protein